MSVVVLGSLGLLAPEAATVVPTPEQGRAAAAVPGPAAAGPLPQQARPKAGRPCRAGSIALTFDDGPSPTMTPRLVRVLLREQVPATFFMVGAKVRRWPATARYVERSGFTIGNHTWSHRELTRLSGRQVRGQLLRAGAELRRTGIETGALMRPPYGAINARVSREIRSLGLVPVLWTADSMDWSGGSALRIAQRILSQLRPYRKNIVLQHDGVANSAASVAAVPIVIRVARARGYCFTDLGPRGGVAPFRSALRSRPSADATGTPKVRRGTAGTAARPSASPTPLLDMIAEAGPIRPWIALPLWSSAHRFPQQRR